MFSEKFFFNFLLVSLVFFKLMLSFPVGDEENEIDSILNETKFVEIDLFEEESNGKTVLGILI